MVISVGRVGIPIIPYASLVVSLTTLNGGYTSLAVILLFKLLIIVVNSVNDVVVSKVISLPFFL